MLEDLDRLQHDQDGSANAQLGLIAGHFVSREIYFELFAICYPRAYISSSMMQFFIMPLASEKKVNE